MITSVDVILPSKILFIGCYMEKLITLEKVTKAYHGKCILDGISHDFYEGESIAFAGHNGCGKSTMLKILAGFTKINKGNVNYHKKVRFSYVPEKFPGLGVKMIDYLNSVAEMEEVPYSKVNQLIKDFFLEDMIQTKMSNMSKGSLQKVGVIQALMAPHDIILLDEPLSGQDTDSQDVFINKVNELKKQGVTIFMSCHEKKLMDELSDKIYTINKGKLEKIEMDSISDSTFKIYVNKDKKLRRWPEMTEHGNRYVLRVQRDEIKDTVMDLYSEEWELVGIEEYI
jgi:ABC-type multidrug transport system ATPase subunit